jgi:hypothetical protein
MSNNKNILIFLNTCYHVETALSVYESIKQINYIPYILIDFELDDKDNGFGLIDFLEKNNLNYLTTGQFDEISDKNFFHKMVVVTASQNSANLTEPEIYPPINYNSRMQLYKDRAILIYHRGNYSNYLNHVNNFFENPRSLSVSPFSQKYGLEYIFQVENPIANAKINFLEKDVLNFLFIGRFCLKNRHTELLEKLVTIDQNLTKQIKIDLIGQKPNTEIPIISFLESQNFKNIKYEFHFDLDQSSFYKKIHNSDFILNLVINNYYVMDRFTSNLHHIIAFSKPNITPLFVNLVYNIPGLNYNKNFEEIFIQATNLNEEEYRKMVLDFQVTKMNMRNHNSMIFNKLFN